MGERTSILVIDNEEVIRLLFKETLEELGHRVATAEITRCPRQSNTLAG